MLQKSQGFLEKLNPFTVAPNLVLSLFQMLKYTFRATDLTIHTKLEHLQVMAVDCMRDGYYFTTEE